MQTKTLGKHRLKDLQKADKDVSNHWVKLILLILYAKLLYLATSRKKVIAQLRSRRKYVYSAAQVKELKEHTVKLI